MVFEKKPWLCRGLQIRQEEWTTSHGFEGQEHDHLDEVLLLVRGPTLEGLCEDGRSPPGEHDNKDDISLGNKDDISLANKDDISLAHLLSNGIELGLSFLLL